MSSERRFTVLRGTARAKVTLSLRVLGTRADGLHELDALAVSCSDPHDGVALYPQPRGTTVAVTPAGAAPSAARDNLAARAVDLLRPELPGIGGVRVRLRKRIPMQAGLGGGSADAAAVLRLLGRHFRLPAPVLARTAARLGSDVPFSLQTAPALVRGRGERIEPVRGVPALALVIATPPFGCPTADVYRAWDELGGPAGERRIDAAWCGAELGNDLEPAAFVVRPALRDFRDAFARATDRTPLLLGSGSSYAVIADDADHAPALAGRTRAALALDTVWAGTTDPARAR